MLPGAALEYIVNDIVRRYSGLPPRFVQNLRRNVRRNFGVTVPAEQIEEFIPLYQGIYRDAAGEIRRWLGGAATPPLEEGDRLATEFGARLAPRYPDQPPAILRLIAGWAVYYEVYR